MRGLAMFKRVLIATDLSASSDAIIDCMAELKPFEVEEVILFYACGVRHLDTIAELIKQSVETNLIRQQKKLESQGFKTNLIIMPGIPSEELKRVCTQKQVSLVIISSLGESAANHILFRLGKVTSEVLHSHEQPLLLIRTKVIEENGERKIVSLCGNLKEKILSATDFSDISMEAFQYVKKLVEDGCKNVTILHVQDKIKIEKYLAGKLEEFDRTDTERLEILKNQLKSKGAETVNVKLLYGIPSKELLEESKKGYSLIVLGSQGHGFFNEIFIGSVSHNIARSADVSVLLIPAKDRGNK